MYCVPGFMATGEPIWQVHKQPKHAHTSLDLFVPHSRDPININYHFLHRHTHTHTHTPYTILQVYKNNDVICTASL